MHAAQDPVAPLFAAGRINQWIECRRCLRQAGDHRQLCDAKLRNGLAVVHLRSRLDSIGTIAKVDLVDVQLEDFVLAELALYLQCQQYLVDLARETPLTGKEVILRHLHGNGAAAGLNLPTFQ